MAYEHRPTPGSPIVSEKTGEVLGWWTERAPLCPDYGRLHWVLYTSPKKRDFSPAQDWDRPDLRQFSVGMAYGKIGGGVQVWEATAESQDDLRGLSGVLLADRPTDDANIRAARAIRDLSSHPIFNTIPPNIADYLKNFSRYFLETADDL